MNVPKLRFKGFSDEYIELKLKDICLFYSGGTPISSNRNFYTGYVPFIRSGEIHKAKTELFVTDEAIKNSSAKYVKKGDLLFALYGATSGDVAISKINGVINQAILCIKPQKVDNQIYIKYLLELNKKSILNKYIQGGQGNLSANIIKNIKFNFCSFKEQSKVANFLLLLDKKIELQVKKIEALKLFKSCTKSKIFKDGNHACKLGAILNKWNKKNKDGAINYVESISNKAGFIPQSEQFEDRNVASKNLRNYYVIKKGVFGYNPSRLNVGSLALKENDSISVVSPLYECFTTTQNNTYLFEWFNSDYFKKETSSRFEGGVRNTLNFNNLCDIPINLPDIETQNKYAKYFNKLNFKISLEEQKLSKLLKYKKALLQDMFI